MGGACSMHGGNDKCVQDYGWNYMADEGDWWWAFVNTAMNLHLP
jgi:hypothetical protein